jgi:hypothetical protein
MDGLEGIFLIIFIYTEFETSFNWKSDHHKHT